jgi:DNA mismatch repair protein MutS
MTFSTDQQTLNDLNITGKPGQNSVYQLFNHTYTRGGANLLEQMFRSPLLELETINKRSSTFQFFSTVNLKFPFKTEHLDGAELYLSITDERTMLNAEESGLANKFSQLFHQDGDYKIIYNGVLALLGLFHNLKDLASKLDAGASKKPYQQRLQEMKDLFADPELNVLPDLRQSGKLAHAEVAVYDKLLRFKSRQKFKAMMAWIYEIDVCISVAEVAAKHQFVFPVALPKGGQIVQINGFYHPLLKAAVGNDISITSEQNVIFLTGANMAGKSTLMKSLGIAMYLAHMGFPVAAQAMRFSVCDGIYSTINLPDDLNSGNSHFYAEVLRVKQMAKELQQGKHLFIIFDELFRGTNVKDACEGTILITEAFAKKRNCLFLVSSHIIEAGEALQTRCTNISYLYLPTIMEGNTPVYTYILKPGLTADRHGMLIINNEEILEIIRSRPKKNKKS